MAHALFSMIFKVGRCLAKFFRVVVESAHATITSVAQKSPHFAGHVVVIDGKSTGRASSGHSVLSVVTDRAYSVLSFVHCPIVSSRHAEFYADLNFPVLFAFAVSGFRIAFDLLPMGFNPCRLALTAPRVETAGSFVTPTKCRSGFDFAAFPTLAFSRTSSWRRPGFVAEQVNFGFASQYDAAFSEPLFDRAEANAKFLGKRHQRFSSHVPLDKIFKVVWPSRSSARIVPSHDSNLLQGRVVEESFGSRKHLNDSFIIAFSPDEAGLI